MDDEDDVTPVFKETPDDDISSKTPGSQETLLDDVSEDDVLEPVIEQESQMSDLLADCPQLAYDHTQRQNSEDTDSPIINHNSSDTIPSWDNTLHNGVGLSQSDNSLSDRNQVAYCYGNQVEYYNAAAPAHETICRACSAPPTPEVVRRILHHSLSSECDVSMYLDEDNDDDDDDDVDGVTLVSPSSQSPPVYTQAPSSSCEVTNSANQPKIVIQPPIAPCHTIIPTRGYSLDKDNNDCFQRDVVLEPQSTTDHNDVTNNVTDSHVNNAHDNNFCSDEAPANSSNDSLIAKPNSINDTQNPLPIPPEGATSSEPPTEGAEEHPEEQVESDVTDSEDEDSVYANLSYGERSFLLDPAFEGMEPTYV